MLEAGLRAESAWCDDAEPDNYLAGAACAATLIARRFRHTAIVAGDDLVLLGISTALERHRITTPGDVSLVGFGDADEIRYHQNPAFTTIRAPRFEMGTELARSLMARIADPARPPHSVVLPTELVVRESCGPPACLE
jgi:LacI family transcriptional regulator